MRSRGPALFALVAGLLVAAVIFRFAAERERADERAAHEAAAGRARAALGRAFSAGDATLFPDRLALDPARLAVEPARLRERLLAAVEFRTVPFDAGTFDRLKGLRRLDDPALYAAVLSLHLDDRADGFVYQKAALWLKLIELKIRLGEPPGGAAERLRRLAEAIGPPAERRFLAGRLAELLKSAPAGRPGRGAEDPPRDARDLRLVRGVREALAADATEPMFHAALTGATTELLLAGRLADGRIGAAFADRAVLERRLAAEFGFRFAEPGAEPSVPLVGPLRVRPIAGRALPYGLATPLVALPLLALAAAFGWLRARERAAGRESERMAEFVAGVAHQLKTPLASALLRLDLAREHARGGDRARAEASLAAATAEAHALAFLFENYTALRRLFDESFTLRLEPLDLAAECDLFFRSHAAETEADRLDLRLEPPAAWILADRWALVTILANLLSNAVKYGARAGRVALALEPAGEDARTVTLAFADGGPGVPADERERIFARFEKGQAGAADARSSGLGLFIARSLARRMGGDLALAPDGGAGARFLLTLPRTERIAG